ncbi:Peroxin 13, N-terminal region-domain-containing protein [Hysterangium stoloniferum]|nr:Peroxin 13, N-terminal region-domain-containing protein [Hysterangium stoloniferum]
MEPMNNAMGVKAQLLPWMVVVRRLLRRNGSPTDDNDCGWEGSEVKDAELDLGRTSTMYMATHSSFFAMVGVAEQFGQLRNALGSVLGPFEMIRWLRGLITGRPVNDGGISDESTSPPACPRMSMGLIALEFEGKVQNPGAEAYDPVQWKSFWFSTPILKANGMPVPLSDLFHLSLILLLWTLRGFRRDTLVERKSFWGAVHYEQVL